MKLKKPGEYIIGTASATAAFVLWGILPVYWKLIISVPSDQIFAHRIVWCFLFMVLVLIVTGRLRGFLHELRGIIARPKKLVGVSLASLFISVNWFFYIWAVNNNQIIETSLGYYINPLVSVLLGIMVLNEKLTFWQTVSFILALIGVINLTINFGAVPWVALLLAGTFGMYGLFKKIVSLDAITGITAETLVLTPFALAYLSYVHKNGNGAFSFDFSFVSTMVMGAGLITAVPLLLFAGGTNRLPLCAVGFLQYVSPTISLILGVYLYNETFTAVHLVSFAFIWAALIIFSLATTRSFIQSESQKKVTHFNE